MTEELRRDYEIAGEIGRGRFGVVRRCISRATGEVFAVKSVDRLRLADAFDAELADVEPKAATVAAAANPGAVQVANAYSDDSWVHIVMELLPGPDLLQWIKLRGGSPVPEPDAAAIISQLMETLAVCHRRGVAHRDVKPDNIMFDAEGRLRLSDFGSAGFFSVGTFERTKMTGVVGTPYYVAPEVIAGGEYCEKVDVWSAGVVLYILLSGGAVPFAGETAEEIFAAVLRANLRFPPRLFTGVSTLAKDVMRRMMCRDVSRRLSAEQVLRHPWIMSAGGATPVEQPT